MNLSDVSHLIQPGDVFLFRGRAWHSRLIRLVTGSVFSHVGLAHRPVSAGLESLDCLEAYEGAGVRTHPVAKYLERGDCEIDWFQITDPTIDRAQVVRWAWERRGFRYASPHQLIRSFLSLPLAETLGWPTRIDGDGRWFCSFFVSEALQAGGWQGNEEPSHLVSPGDLSLFPCLQRRGTIRHLH